MFIKFIEVLDYFLNIEFGIFENKYTFAQLT